ncbi:hypothetical protein, partial [Saccharophagus degradans]|uniref:hypothetical protein n=1 Tax=Saccharophagus degradans TaxID=86304 RepID=UPI0026E25F39
QKSRQKKKEKWILLRSQLGLRSCEAFNVDDCFLVNKAQPNGKFGLCFICIYLLCFECNSY